MIASSRRRLRERRHLKQSSDLLSCKRLSLVRSHHDARHALQGTFREQQFLDQTGEETAYVLVVMWCFCLDGGASSAEGCSSVPDLAHGLH